MEVPAFAACTPWQHAHQPHPFQFPLNNCANHVINLVILTACKVTQGHRCALHCFNVQQLAIL